MHSLGPQRLIEQAGPLVAQPSPECPPPALYASQAAFSLARIGRRRGHCGPVAELRDAIELVELSRTPTRVRTVHVQASSPVVQGHRRELDDAGDILSRVT